MVTPRRLEWLSYALLALVLILRYPVHFALSPPYLMDFNVYRAAAERVAHGEGARLYDPVSTEKMMFKYAPCWALAWRPLARFSSHTGAVLWTALDLAALLATLLLCAGICRRLRLRAHPLTGVAATLLIVRPLAEEMGNGQVNLLWGALIAAFVYAEIRRWPWRAACALAGAMLLKLPALILLPYLVLRRRWKAAARVLAIAAWLTAAAIIVIAPGEPLRLLHGWAHALFANAQTYAFEIGNQSLLALLGRFLTADGFGLNLADIPRAALAILAAGVVALLVVALGQPRRSDREDPRGFLYDSAIMTVLMVIGSPSCWLATYTTLLFPLFVALAGLADRLARGRRDFASLGLLGAVLGLACFTQRRAWHAIGLSAWHGEAYLFLVFMILPWLGLLLIGLLWRLRGASARTSRSSATGTPPPSTRSSTPAALPGIPA